MIMNSNSKSKCLIYVFNKDEEAIVEHVVKSNKRYQDILSIELNHKDPMNTNVRGLYSKDSIDLPLFMDKLEALKVNLRS